MLNTSTETLHAHAEYKCGRNIEKNTRGESKLCEDYFWALTQSFTVSILAYMFCSTWIPRAILEELSNQRRSKKIGNGKETPGDRAWRAAETAKQMSEQLRKRRERDRARRAAQTASETQATSQRKVPLNVKVRQLSPLRRNKITADE